MVTNRNDTETSSPLDESMGQVRLQSHFAGKPVYTVETRILNPDSDFAEKELCTGPTFSAGSSCVFSCKYCYVESMMNRGGSEVSKVLQTTGRTFQDLVLRRNNPLERLRAELRNNRGELIYKNDTRTVYASPTVDVAANMELVRETITLVMEILDSTGWTIRLLSKSPLIRLIAEAIPPQHKHRVILGLSTGTFDEKVAKAIEPDVPPPHKRLETLKKLQEEGFRTFAMLCPILPQDPVAFIMEAAAHINFDACEHVWAEVLNRRGLSMQRTAVALKQAGLTAWAQRLHGVFGTGSTPAWEAYARDTFAALADVVPAGKLRFLQYVTPRSIQWWKTQEKRGAILLGKATKRAKDPMGEDSALKAKRSAAAKKAWVTIRKNRAMSVPVLPPTDLVNHHSADGAQLKLMLVSSSQTPGKKAWETMRHRYTPEQIRSRAQAAARKAWQTIRAKKK
jgi:DNA repair photolyase